ncbi:MAG: HD domain-containing protein [Terriglobales bacterium]
MKVIRDAVHGDIELSAEEMRVIHTAEFTRLHGCRQLGITHLIYPAAKHARFEHVLGVLHVASLIADELEKRKVFFIGENGARLRSILRFSALLHDMGHVPFGHTLEDEMPVISKHDIPSEGQTTSRMDVAVRAVLNESGNSAFIEPVLQVLRAIAESKDDDILYRSVNEKLIHPDYLALADIIGNTICADLLDYIKRDHIMTGIRATYDDRILRYFGIGEHRHVVFDQKTGKRVEKRYKRVVINLVKNGRVRNDALADLLDILKLRYNLSDKVLFHPKKCSADAMLIRAITELGLTAEDLIKLSDDGLLDQYREHPLISMIRRRELFKPVFSCGPSHVSSYDKEMDTEELVNRVHSDTKLRGEIEHAVENELGLPGGQASVLVFCPRMKMTFKPIRALVTWKDGTVKRLNELEEKHDVLTAKQISLLQEIYYGLWKLYVFVPPSLRSRGAQIQRKFVEILKQKTGLIVASDPALQNYLETGCADYAFGQALGEELEQDPRYHQLEHQEQATVATRCFAKLPRDPWDDAFSEQDTLVASRLEPEALARQVKAIIDGELPAKGKKDRAKADSSSQSVTDSQTKLL